MTVPQQPATVEPEVGSYFVANYPPFSVSNPGAVDRDARLNAITPWARTLDVPQSNIDLIAGMLGETDGVAVHPDLHPLIVDTLAGNVYADLTPLYKALDEHTAARGADVQIDAATARSTDLAAVRAVP